MVKSIVPDYLGDFSCIGSECEDTCCAGWKVLVDKKTYQAYRNVPNKPMRQTLAKVVTRNRTQNGKGESSYAKINLGKDRKCPLLSDTGLCTIQTELGYSYLCDTCAIYPRYYSSVGGIVEQSLTISCPEAARIILQKKEGIGFIEQEVDANNRVNRSINLSKYPYFWDLRIYIIELIQNRTQSLETRLILLGLFLQRIKDIPIENYPNELPQLMEDYKQRLNSIEFITLIEELEPAREFQLHLATVLLANRANMGLGSEKYQELLSSIVEGLYLNDEMEKKIAAYETAYKQYYEPFSKEHEYLLENYIVNYIFKNLMPYDKSSFQESYMMLSIHIMLIKLHVVGKAAVEQNLEVVDFIECVYLIGRTIEHSGVYLNAVRKGMLESNFTTMGHFITLIK